MLNVFLKYFNKMVSNIYAGNAGEVIPNDTRQCIKSNGINLKLSASYLQQQMQEFDIIV